LLQSVKKAGVDQHPRLAIYASRHPGFVLLRIILGRYPQARLESGAMRSLRVLITNNTLAERAGSELYVRDLALGLLARGHTPIAYSSKLGEVADELHRATVPTLNDLDPLGTPPDLIHGHHHVETMTALLRFPDVPAIYFCHGWTPWEEMPLRFPRIVFYVAVDHTCRDRLVCEGGIPEQRVRVLLNFVDMRRFRSRPPLPSRPRRALIFSNYASENSHVPAVREACARAGLELDVMGMANGNPCSQPEKALGGYDLVFAKGRAALEALATGAAVILCDAAGAGPLVTSAEVDRLRPLNFGLRALRHPVTADYLLGEISRFNADDATEVSRRIRTCAGVDLFMEEIIALYLEALAAPRPLRDAHEEGPAAAAYLRAVSPVFQAAKQAPLRLACERLAAARDALGSERDQLLLEQQRLHARFQQLEERSALLQRENERLCAALVPLRAERDQLVADRDGLRLENQRLRAEGKLSGTELERLRADLRCLQMEQHQLRAALLDVHGSPTMKLRALAIRVPLLRQMVRSVTKV
jgi:Glycosyltransferase Family 4